MFNYNKMVSCTFCRIKRLNTYLRMRIEEMEEGGVASIHDKEVKVQNTRVGNAEIDSNGCKGRGEK
jgi:hypothetical protein